jgi:uncharacterized membrane protein
LFDLPSREEKMSNLVVIAFDDADEAAKVRADLKKLEHMGRLSLDDSAVIVKDEDGQIHVKNEIDQGVKTGVAGGGFLGLMVGFWFGGPIFSMLLGAVGGALVGSSLDMGIRKDFVKEVSSALQSGSSALFVIVRESDPATALAALRPYQGTIIQTTLSTEAEESLRAALAKKS